MAFSINAIQHVAAVQPLELESTKAVTQSGSGGAFQSVLTSAVQAVEQSRATADQAVQGFLNGTGGELHSTILATQRAELQLQMFLQLRNKLVQSYQEVMRVQV